MSQDIMMKVDGVSKEFKLPHEKNTSIKGAVIGFTRRKQQFERQRVLKDISFEVKKGEFLGITGRNGSGKSTMLKLLAGIYVPTKGGITVNGKLTPFIELGVGFNHELTGRDNVFLNGALLGFTRKEMAAMYNDIVKFAELEKFMDQKLKNYSSGMQVRLAFSIAIRAQSDILLIDEVLAVGDVNFQNKCIAVFEEIKRRGTTVVFVSHDMEAVRRFCDRVILIQDGEIVKTGDPQSVIDEYLALNVTSTISKGSPFGVEDAAKDEGMLKIVKTSVTDKNGKSTKELKNDKYYVDVEVKFVGDCGDCVPGVVIRNQSGIRVTASNTEWIDARVPKFKKGQKVTFRFEFSNVLERGIYFVSTNAVSGKSRKFYDWDNDAVEFRVENKPATGGVVNPPYSIEIIEEA